MGKTSISLAVVELPLIKDRFPLGNRFWVPCIEATSATRLLEILYIQLQVPGDKQQVTLISELDASNQPRLILFDNFETLWNAPDGTQKQVGDILRRLVMLTPVPILVTTRGNYPPYDKAIKWQSKDIRPADEGACLHIHHDINPDSENAGWDTCLSPSHSWPIWGKEGSTAKELLDAWSKFGPDILTGAY